MRKLISLVMILAMPAMVFGATAYSVENGGASSASFEVGSVPAALNLDIMLSLDATGAGTFGFFGALDGPAVATIATRTFNAPVSSWGFQSNLPAAYDGKPITALLDFGAIESAGTQPTLGASAVHKLMTLNVTGLGGLGVGDYNFVVVSSADLGAGASWSNTGEPIPVDASNPFVLHVTAPPNPTPEPATMLLLAAALPFLRRRSA